MIKTPIIVIKIPFFISWFKLQVTVSYNRQLRVLNYYFSIKHCRSQFRVDSDVVESAVIAVIHCCATYLYFPFQFLKTVFIIKYFIQITNQFFGFLFLKNRNKTIHNSEIFCFKKQFQI